MLRLNGTTGCSEQPLTAFGSDEDLFRAETADASLACWAVNAPAGKLMVATGSPWTLFDAGGDPVCTRGSDIYAFAEFCRVPVSGSFTFVATSPIAGTRFRIPVIAAQGANGC